MIFLGCDAGSTKTEFLVATQDGKLLARELFPACNYLEMGEERFARTMRGFAERVCEAAGIGANDPDFTVFGLPALGEVEDLEEGAAEALGEYAREGRSLLVNDAVLGWAGSLAGAPGINIVSGTGSITYGEDPQGGSKRVSGWSLLFDDPGSCAWVGRQTLSLFFKQADGRIPRGALYDVLREYWGLGDHPEYFAGKALYMLNTNRSELAKVQLLTRRAADLGDEAAVELYREAVELLAESARVVRDALCFPAAKPVMVSYSGGFFRNGDWVLTPLREAIRVRGMALVAPKYSPAVGALALGAKRYLAQEALSLFLKNIQEVIDRTAD